MTVTKKVTKTLEGLAGCQNIFKEPKSFYAAKKVTKTLEGLAGCQNIWKEPKSFYEPDRAAKKALREKKHAEREIEVAIKRVAKAQKKAEKEAKMGNTTCSLCGTMGHNKRTCVSPCPPCKEPLTQYD
jgi:predicted Zn-ribbon and HTH transcriptional regulator